MTHPPLLGIVGGYGPKTSAEFCSKVVAYAQKLTSTHAPSFAMDSVPIDMAVAGRCIAGDREAALLLGDGINASIARLHALGVRSIAIPCNSVHAVYSSFAQKTDVDLIHIVDPLLRRLQKRGVRRIGFLSTGLTASSDIYDSRLRSAGMEILSPNPEDQQALNAAIAFYVRTGKASDDARRLLQKILASYPEKEAECIVLACTDLSGMMAACALKPTIPVEDSLDALAEECALRSIPHALTLP